MPVSREDALTAILHAILNRLEQAAPDAAGNVDEATQADVDAIAALADEEHLPGLLAELNSSQDGPSFTASIYALASAGATASELAAAATELASRTSLSGRKFATFSGWEEEKHPRGGHGHFASKVGEYLGRQPRHNGMEVLPHAEFSARFASPDDALTGGTAAIRTPDGKIYLREGHEGSGLHELVHAAGTLEDGVGQYVNEGFTQAIAEDIAARYNIDIPKTYQDNVGFVRNYVIPATGKSLQDVARGYATSPDKGRYLAQLIWDANGHHFADPDDWGSDQSAHLEALRQEAGYGLGPGPRLDYLVNEKGVGRR